MKYKYHFTSSPCYIILLIIVLSACGKKLDATYPTVDKITHSVYASGTIKSVAQYEAYSKVNGILDQLLVKEGDLVTKGQTILKLANKAQELGYENAKLLANYSSENSNLEWLN